MKPTVFVLFENCEGTKRTKGLGIASIVRIFFSVTLNSCHYVHSKLYRCVFIFVSTTPFLTYIFPALYSLANSTLKIQKKYYKKLYLFLLIISCIINSLNHKIDNDLMILAKNLLYCDI